MDNIWAWFTTKIDFINYMEMDEMYSKIKLSTRTRDNWWVNIVQVSSGIIATLSGIYFLFFALMPWYTAIDKCKPEPARVTGH